MLKGALVTLTAVFALALPARAALLAHARPSRHGARARPQCSPCRVGFSQPVPLARARPRPA